MKLKAGDKKYCSLCFLVSLCRNTSCELNLTYFLCRAKSSKKEENDCWCPTCYNSTIEEERDCPAGVIGRNGNDMKYYVTFKVDARYVAEVEAENIEEARKKATDSFQDADFGRAEDVDGEEVIVEDEDGNYVWEKE